MSFRYFFLVVLLLFTSFLVFGAPRVALISVEGNVTISSTEILEHVVHTEIGKPINQRDLKADMENIMNMGSFSNISVKTVPLLTGVDVVFAVTENPVVKEVKVEGNTLVSASSIESVITIEKGKAFNVNDYRSSVEAIKEEYREKAHVFLVAVDSNLSMGYKKISIPDGVLRFKIREYRLWDLKVTGSASQILSKEELKKRIGIHFVADYEKLEPLWKLFYDKKQLYPKLADVQRALAVLKQTRYYSDKSSVAFEPVTEEITAESTANLLYLVLKLYKNEEILEGLPVKTIKFEGSTLFSESELLNKLPEEATKTNVKWVEDVCTKMVNDYVKKDILGVSVKPEYDNGILLYKIYEPKIREIKYTGNVKTKDYLIKRSIKFKKGDFMRLSAYRDTERNLKNSGFFSSVNVNYIPITATSIDVDITLKENEKTGKFGGALSWSMPTDPTKQWYEGFIGKLDVSETNIFGYGQTISLNLQLGAVDTFTLDYKLPWAFNSPLSLDANLHRTRQEEYKLVDSTKQFYYDLRQGGNVGLDVRLNDYNFISMGGKIEYFEKTPAGTPTFLATSGISNGVSISYTFDARDNIFTTRNGMRLGISSNLNGYLLGGSENYVQLLGDLRMYKEVFKDNVIAGRLLVGKIYDETNQKAFYVGGATTVRGFNWSDFKGQEEGIINLEYRWIVNETVELVAFADTGAASDTLFSNISWDKSGKSVGVGMRINVPMFGEFRLDYAFPYDNATSSFEEGKLEFAIGEMF